MSEDLVCTQTWTPLSARLTHPNKAPSTSGQCSHRSHTRSDLGVFTVPLDRVISMSNFCPVGSCGRALPRQGVVGRDGSASTIRPCTGAEGGRVITPCVASGPAPRWAAGRRRRLLRHARRRPAGPQPARSRRRRPGPRAAAGPGPRPPDRHAPDVALPGGGGPRLRGPAARRARALAAAAADRSAAGTSTQAHARARADRAAARRPAH